jgi:spermidine synthase
MAKRKQQRAERRDAPEVERRDPATATVSKGRRGATLPTWAALCFFTSGAAGLVYEAVWSKQLSYLLGSSLHAVATVVAAFLGGLALGARFLGVPLARRPGRLRAYARLELGVAVAAALLLPALHALDPLVGVLYRAFGPGSVGFGIARLLLLFVVLVPPAALMGATLPVLVAEFERGRIGPALARLYALNTFGAVAGSILGGFVLIPGVGLVAATAVAVTLNVAVAALAWVRGKRGAEPVEVSPARAEAPDESALPERPRRIFVVLFGLAGFAALAFQIAWVRLFGLVLGSSVYSFSAVLGGYLLGIALGSLAAARFATGRPTLAGFGKLQLALAATAALQLWFFGRVPGWVYAIGQATGPHFALLFIQELGLVLAFILVPCALLGAAFPLGARLLQRADGGHATAIAYAINTVGTIAGSLLAGFVCVPAWGVKGTELAALVVSLAVGVVALALEVGPQSNKSPPARLRFVNLRLAAAATIVTLGLALFAPAWDPALMTAGAFRPNQAAYMNTVAGSAEASAVWKATRSYHVLYYREGINASVIVVGSEDSRGTRIMRVGGKIDASTGDMETQVISGLLPAALADRGARTMIIGLGSGFTVSAALAAGVGPTEVVELEPGVVEASRFFHEPGHDPLEDPRTTLMLDDARTRLAHGGGKYGVIISEPSNPWIAGVNSLFTVDFYRLVKTRLEPDGVFCQWLQLYELTPETFATLARSFIEVFPEGNLFAVWRNSDAILIAAPRTRRLALDRLHDPAVLALLDKAHLASPEALAANYAAPLSALAPLAAGAPFNTDDRPVVEYRAPRDMVEVGRSAILSQLALPQTMPEGKLFADWPAEQWFGIRARAFLAGGEGERASAVVGAARAAGLTVLADHLGDELESRRREGGASPFEAATKLMLAGDAPAARAAFERVVAADPTNSAAWLSLADCRQAMDDLDGAEEALSHARGSTDSLILAQAAMVAGTIASSRQRPRDAAARFAEAQRLDPRISKAYVLEASALSATQDRDGATRALRRGLAALPGDAEMTAMLSQLADAR